MKGVSRQSSSCYRSPPKGSRFLELECSYSPGTDLWPNMNKIRTIVHALSGRICIHIHTHIQTGDRRCYKKHIKKEKWDTAKYKIDINLHGSPTKRLRTSGPRTIGWKTLVYLTGEMIKLCLQGLWGYTIPGIAPALRKKIRVCAVRYPVCCS